MCGASLITTVALLSIFVQDESQCSKPESTLKIYFIFNYEYVCASV